MIAPRVIVRTPRPHRALERPSGDSREELIRHAAYLIAERRGFVPGHEVEDWLLAEQQVDELLRHCGGALSHLAPAG